MDIKKLLEVNESDFENEVLNQQGLVLVDLWAPWCGPCLALAPKIKDIAEGIPERVVKLNIDQNPLLTGKLGVRGIPTMILFKGGEEVARLVGNQPKDVILNWIERHR